MSAEPSKGSDRYPPLFPPGNAKAVMAGLVIGSVLVALIRLVLGRLFGPLAVGIALLVMLIVAVAVGIHVNKKQKAAASSTPRS